MNGGKTGNCTCELASFDWSTLTLIVKPAFFPSVLSGLSVFGSPHVKSVCDPDAVALLYLSELSAAW